MNHILVKESCSDMRRQARELLRGKWKNAMLISAIYYLLIGGVETVIMLLFGNPTQYGPDASTGLMLLYTMLVVGPLTFGLMKCFCRIAENGQVPVGELFSGFEDFGKLFLVNLFITIFVFLWGILFVIPGIIAALAYSMTFFMIVSNGDLRPLEAIGLSKSKMRGNKGKFLLLCLSFIGWILLWLLAAALVTALLGGGFYMTLSSPGEMNANTMQMLRQDWIIDQLVSQIFAIALYMFLMPYIIMTQFVFYRHLTGWKKLSIEGQEADLEPEPKLETESEIVHEPEKTE